MEVVNILTSQLMKKNGKRILSKEASSNKKANTKYFE